MGSGLIDGLAFIGGTVAADLLIKQHPEPHRLKVFLQLEAKNMAIVLNDLVENTNKNEKKRNNKNEINTNENNNNVDNVIMLIMYKCDGDNDSN